MKYTKKQFLIDVATEVKTIKKNATPSEISNLNLETLEPDQKTTCIYGQMTGHCRSKRAIALITECCPRYVRNNFSVKHEFETFSNISKNVNGEKVELGERISFFSMVETYILTEKAKPENVISYLKGGAKKLIL